MNAEGRSIWAPVGIGAIVLVLLAGFVFLLGFRTVDAGTVCAVTRLGELVGQVGEGPHWALRGLYAYRCFSERTMIYETSDFPDESGADYTDFTVDANTADGQQISITFGVGFHVIADDVEWVYLNVGRSMAEVVERVVKLNARSEVRKLAQGFPASQLYSGDILAYEETVRVRLEELLAASHIVLDTFTIRKITFDTDYMQAIEQQQIARENIETANFQSQSAEYEADRVAVLARGEAQAAVERATGQAEVIRITAQADADAAVIAATAEAEAIRLRGEALAAYPLVLQLDFIRQLDSIDWMVLPDNVLPVLPFANP